MRDVEVMEPIALEAHSVLEVHDELSPIAGSYHGGHDAERKKNAELLEAFLGITSSSTVKGSALNAVAHKLFETELPTCPRIYRSD